MNPRQTIQRLEALALTLARSGNPDKPFFYLGGPMTGIPQYNFPRFREVGDKLRTRGMNIVSPAEFDTPEVEKQAMESHDGMEHANGEAVGGADYNDFLARDFIVCSLPTCLGGIFIEGWHNSRGARGETWLLAYLGRRLLEYDDTSGKPSLTPFDRDARLQELGVPAEARGAVPADAPGALTVAASSVKNGAGLDFQSPRRYGPLSIDPLGPLPRRHSRIP